jgi:hypothetical protein
MRELRTIDTFGQECMEALLACGEYFENENSPLEYQNDADKINRNFSSGHTEKLTRKTLKARKHGEKPLERQCPQKGREKLRENTQFRKSSALRKHIPRKYEDPKSNLSFNSKGSRSANYDVHDDAWILRVVTPSSARVG